MVKSKTISYGIMDKKEFKRFFGRNIKNDWVVVRETEKSYIPKKTFKSKKEAQRYVQQEGWFTF